jgi:hypothetical protein
MAKTKRKPGRPRKRLSAKGVKKLAKLGCTNVEVADFYGVSADTIERNYAGAIKAGREDYHMSIRRALTKQMTEGKPGPTIFLAKTQLGMRDTIFLTTPPDQPIQAKVEDVTALSPAERKRRLAELKRKASGK